VHGATGTSVVRLESDVPRAVGDRLDARAGCNRLLPWHKYGVSHATAAMLLPMRRDESPDCRKHLLRVGRR